MGERADRVRASQPLDDVRGTGAFASVASGQSSESPGAADAASRIEQTRAEMTETIDAIQDRLAPERITDQAKDAAADATEQAKTAALSVTDHAIEEVKAAVQDAKVAFQEWGGVATEQAKTTALEVTDQAKSAALAVTDHALVEAKAAVQEWGEIAQVAALEAVDHAIGEAKSAVRELGEQAKASVRDATIGRVERVATNTTETAKGFRAGLIETIKQNPMPAALTGLGLGWLMMNRSSTPSSGQAAYPSGSYGSYRSSGGYDGTTSDGGQNVAGKVADQAQETAGQVAGQVQETVGQVANQVQGAAGQVVDQVQHTADQVQHQAQRVEDRFRLMLNQNPLPLGAAALAVGGAIGLALPGTRREQALMGEAREALGERVEETAQDALQKVQRVGEEVQETVKKEARYQGLSEQS